MEHLHPEDAAEQLRNIYRVLKPGGRYICITPSKLSGPHDVSKYFDDEPTGFHLKEYSTGELAAVFRIAGFQEIYPFLWIKQRLILLPLAIVSFLEGRLSKLTRTTRYRLCNRAPLNHLLGRVVAVRPCK
jgi:SAM-dependent methyltransferase